ncbi:WD repeat-containing protein 90 [Manis javanica]|nr:WD repeat-containing protein 90 [Manis javanica]
MVGFPGRRRRQKPAWTAQSADRTARTAPGRPRRCGRIPASRPLALPRPPLPWACPAILAEVTVQCDPTEDSCTLPSVIQISFFICEMGTGIPVFSYRIQLCGLLKRGAEGRQSSLQGGGGAGAAGSPSSPPRAGGGGGVSPAPAPARRAARLERSAPRRRRPEPSAASPPRPSPSPRGGGGPDDSESRVKTLPRGHLAMCLP